MLKPIDNYTIQKFSPVKDALAQLNALDNLILFVLDNHLLIGTITDGDIRRGLITGLSLDNPVDKFMNTNFRSCSPKGLTPDFFLELKKDNIKIVPVLKSNGELIRLLDVSKFKAVLPVTALIMAGGRGERLRPMTDNCPKPMLFVGDKPILEHVIDRMIEFGIINIFISVKYLGDQIISYFGDGSAKGVNIEYIIENDSLGTFGAVSLIDPKKYIHDYLLVMNSDLLTNIDFSDLYNHSLNTEADFTVASIPYKVDIPYAILEEENGIVKSISEKPTYTYYANAGIYLFKRYLVNNIEKNSFINAPNFCEHLVNSFKKVAIYPLLGYWMDIGRHEDYIKANMDIKHIKL